MGKNGLQKDLDALTDKRKAGGESPATIEIREDKLGENTRQGSEKETTAIPPAIQAQIDALKANVQGLKKQHSPLNEVDHRTGSPFCIKIRAAQPPAKYKTLTLTVYTGKETR